MVSAETYLVSSIVLETSSTCLIKNTLNDKRWFIPVYTGYAISFYIFPKCLKKFQLGVAYSIWSGMGIILTLLYDIICMKSVCTIKQLFGMLSVVIGICLVGK